MIDWDSNYIKLVPLKSRKSNSIVTTYRDTYNWFKTHGFQATLLKLNNEVSKMLINAITDDDLDYQLVSLNDHCQNPAERAIQDVKSHFISIRSITDKSFPLDGWDLLLQHTEDTLNML
mmetsp:Transcript_977/g.2135  ORF Transcript_977/g.2135 Transcript_977/m.2135 type:complete len:119 (+) Transcript_977:138-494(+)